MSENDKIEYKVTLIGNSSVGKTSLFKKITTGEFSDKNISTIGMDKRTVQVEIEVQEKDKNVTKSIDISLVDTAGQERFKSITKSYYKESDGILLIYDITNRESFENVKNWIDSIYDSLGNQENSKYIIILIGNKVDLIGVEEYVREVNEDEGKAICEEKGLIWGGETSVKNIQFQELENLFRDYVKHIYDKVGEKKIVKQVTKKMDGYKKKRKSGCFF